MDSGLLGCDDGDDSCPCFRVAEAADDRRGLLRTGREHAAGRGDADGRRPGAGVQRPPDRHRGHLHRRLHRRLRGHKRRSPQEGNYQPSH